jgi:AbrB family looped-hinge helix DNA binding protein
LGVCARDNPFRGVVTVSDKGQIVIPIALVRELGIERGSQLIILKRDDGLGFVALKSTAIADTLSKLANSGT